MPPRSQSKDDDKAKQADQVKAAAEAKAKEDAEAQEKAEAQTKAEEKIKAERAKQAEAVAKKKAELEAEELANAKKGQFVLIKSTTDSRRRAGMKFTKEGVRINSDELTEEQAIAISTDPLLQILPLG